ncbi:PDGLE domain-containing protein [Nocardioides alkalitolerans]|uniref:PDGLE domain-containing protein n=1 Tax=Nocardioides alkalitolerans TaxID=281714 RepID=UPI00040DFBC2|nr:PDGLE domain-containing protein [Nocardioides alkalitolerans]
MSTTTPRATRPRRVSRRAFYATALVVTILVAGGLSYFASSHPDGLEHVAGQTGFLGSADDSPTADSPFADYATRGVDDTWLSGALAGVVGVAVVLLLAGGLALAVRRRGRHDADDADGTDDSRDTVDRRVG